MQTKTYKQGEHVFCDGSVCLVNDIRTLDFAADPTRRYYVLKPVSGSGSTLYLPVDGEDASRRLRYVLSREQIDALLERVRGRSLEWQSDRKTRTQEHHDILMSADHEQLLLLIRCIYLEREKRAQAGKHLSSSDEITLQSAQKLISEEFRWSLSLSPEETGAYIRAALGIA